MIDDIKLVSDAVMALLKYSVSVSVETSPGVFIESIIPVEFFNSQPKLKKEPVYPSLIVQPFLPRDASERQVWTHRVSVKDGDDVTVYSPPKCMRFGFQVSGFSQRYDEYLAMYQSVQKLVAKLRDQKYITINSENYDLKVRINDEVPTIEEGTFHFVLIFDIFVPVSFIDPEVLQSIVTSTLNVEDEEYIFVAN